MPTVRVIYLVPSDREEQEEFTTTVAQAALHVQRWYWNQLAHLATFHLDEPPVEVVRTAHAAAWYASNPHPDPRPGWYWLNAVDDAIHAAGAVLDDPRHRWAVYLDAELGPAQNGGAAAGIAVMHRYDLLGLAGRNVLSGEGEDRIERWVGGLAHELGHTFGLPHPHPCERNPDHPDCRSLMYFGYRTYPDTELLPADIAHLRDSPFCQHMLQPT